MRINIILLENSEDLGMGWEMSKKPLKLPTMVNFNGDTTHIFFCKSGINNLLIQCIEFSNSIKKSIGFVSVTPKE